MSELPLPFSIVPALSSRGLVTFTAVVAGNPITSERYAPGDGEKRRMTAAQWAADDRLCNGQVVKAKDITAELESAEFRAREMQADGGDVGDDGDVARERASFVDDRIIVELAWNRDTRRADYIVFDRASHTIERCEEAETAGGIIVVPSFCKGIVTPGPGVDGCVLVPTCANESGEDEPALRKQIEEFISRYVELPEGGLAIVTEYVLLSWTFDTFDELPYLAFRTADLGRGKSRALETVGSICYRPLFVGGGSSAPATLRMLDGFAGTLVADEFDAAKDSELGTEINRIINQGFQANRPIVKCDGDRNEPRPFRCYGPKLFALRKRLGDDASESRTISITMEQRTRDDVPINLPRRKFDREALALRNRLLYWRFANLGKIALDPSLVDPSLEDRQNQIGVPLLCVARSEAARQTIVDALRRQQAAVAADRADSLAGEIVSVILGMCGEDDVVRPRDVAAEVNRLRAEAAGVDADGLTGRQRMSPHAAGKILRNDLGLPHLPKDNEGVRYRLEPGRMRQLCLRFGEDPSRLPGGHPVATSPTSQGHSSSLTSPENPLFNSASGVGDVGDVHQKAPGLIGDDAPETSPERKRFTL